MVEDIINYSTVRIHETKYLESVALQYKKTSTDSEKVAGLAAQIDPSDAQYASIYAGTGRFIGVFDKQSTPGYNSSLLLSDYYARDGHRVNIIVPWLTPTAVRAYISAGQTIAKYDLVMPVSGGTFSKWDGTKPAVGMALEAITTTSAADIGKVVLFPLSMDNPFNGLKLIEETVTISSNAATLTYTPKLVQYAEAITQTASDHKVKRVTGNTTSPLQGEVYISFTTGAVKTNATDAVTSLKVRYWY